MPVTTPASEDAVTLQDGVSDNPIEADEGDIVYLGAHIGCTTPTRGTCTETRRSYSVPAAMTCLTPIQTGGLEDAPRWLQRRKPRQTL